MPFSVSLLSFLRGQDLDSDLQRIAPGDYARALDIRTITSAGQTSYAVEDIKGNKHIFTLPTVTRQNKIMRVFLSVSVSTTIVLFIRDDNGLVATTFAFTSANINTGLAALSTSILTVLGLTGNTVTTTSTVTDTTNGYVDVEITTILGKDWSITGQYGTLQEVTITTLQEAIDVSIANPLIPIGGKDLLGDLFIYSTSQDNLPTQIDILTITQSGTLFLVTTSVPHGAQSGFEIAIQGAESSPNILSNANGTWIINVLSPTTFELLGSVWDANATGGTVTVSGHGLGEIGVSQFDFTTNTATYTTLIRSKKFNFNTLKQIDCTIKKTNVQFDLKWTDDYNIPRVFYYRGAFTTNGAITIINPEGLYNYETLEEETRLFINNPSMRITSISQFQTGGAVQSGNWRYAVRGITDAGTTSELSQLSGDVNVYTADYNGNPKIIIGDAPDVITTKINEVTVADIPRGIFKYLELIGVNYIGSSFTGYLIRRDVTGDSDTQVLKHLGTETLQDFDVGQLNLKNAVYSQFKNICRIENRVVLSNGVSPKETDLSIWAHNIQYRLKQLPNPTYPDGVGSVGDVFNIKAGEYQNPQNVFNLVGYMHNETYRFGIEVQYRDSGVWSSAFHVADITFDKSGASGQRLQGLFTFALTDNNFQSPTPLICYVQFTNLDPDFILSDGRRIVDVISAIRFVRAEVVPEVLTCGFIHCAVKATLPPSLGGGQTSLFSYPGYSALTSTGNYPQFFLNGATTQLGAKTAFRKFGCFYSQDVLTGDTSISSFSSDVGVKLKVLGQPVRVNGTAFYTGNPAFGISNEFTEYHGWYNNANPFFGDYNDFNLDSLQPIPKAGSISISGETYTTAIPLFNSPPNTAPDQWEDQRGLVVHATADITGSFQDHDGGHYYAQIFKALVDKYGDTRLTKYIGTGQFAEITNVSLASDTYDVFGGDTFIQKTYFHHRYKNTIATPPNTTGYGGGYGFYSQNRINAQMRSGTTGTFPRSEALTPINFFIGNWLQNLSNEDFAYNQGYNIRNEIQIDSAFDPLQIQQTDLPTIFIYSEPQPENSLTDMERWFLPLNFKYAENIYGEVMWHGNINGSLLALQRKAFSDMYFNPSALISTQDGSEVITGTGAVMARPQNVLSTHGTDNKWSVGTWLSAGGKDILGWISNLKSIVRFGYDGTVVISDRDNIASFVANNFTDVPDTPAHGEGVNFVSHQRYGDCIWTVKNPAFNQNYSLVWNERENKFKAFYTAKPNISFAWFNFYVSSNPALKSEIWQADAGNYLEFFGTQNDGFIELIFHSAKAGRHSINEDVIKRDLAMYFNCEIRPYKVEYETKQFKTVTYPNDPDVEQNVDDFYVPVKQDILTSSNGLNNFEDTSDIYGNYLLIRFWFQGGVYQRLRSAVIKFNADARVYAK